MNRVDMLATAFKKVRQAVGRGIPHCSEARVSRHHFPFLRRLARFPGTAAHGAVPKKCFRSRLTGI